VSDENWRISWAARCMNYWDNMTGHAFHRADNTADGGCFSRAEIKHERRVACIEMTKRCNVRGGKIADVDEVAFACSIGRWIVGSEDREWRPMSGRRIYGQRDQMSLWLWRSTSSPSGSAPAALKQRHMATRNSSALRASASICSSASLERP
jgi:hypothetical protein